MAKSNVVPTIGRIVIYTPSQDDKPCVNNGVSEVPALIVRTWEDTSYENSEVNLRVFADGEETPWRTSVPYDESGKEGTWRWPKIVSSNETVTPRNTP